MFSFPEEHSTKRAGAKRFADRVQAEIGSQNEAEQDAARGDLQPRSEVGESVGRRAPMQKGNRNFLQKGKDEEKSREDEHFVREEADQGHAGEPRADMKAVSDQNEFAEYESLDGGESVRGITNAVRAERRGLEQQKRAEPDIQIGRNDRELVEFAGQDSGNPVPSGARGRNVHY